MTGSMGVATLLITGCLDGGEEVPAYAGSLYNPESRGIDASNYEFTHATWNIPEDIIIPTDFAAGQIGTRIREGFESTTEIHVPEPVGVIIHRFDDQETFEDESDIYRINLGTSEDREATENIEGYDVYHIEELYGGVNEEDMILLEVEEFDSETIEVTVETLERQSEPFPSVNNNVAQLLGTLGDGDFVRGMMTPPSDSDLSGSEFGVRISMNDETMDLRYAHVYEENGGLDELAALAEDDLGDDGEIVGESVTDGVATVDAEAEVVEDTERVPLDS